MLIIPSPVAAKSGMGAHQFFCLSNRKAARKGAPTPASTGAPIQACSTPLCASPMVTATPAEMHAGNSHPHWRAPLTKYETKNSKLTPPKTSIQNDNGMFSTHPRFWIRNNPPARMSATPHRIFIQFDFIDLPPILKSRYRYYSPKLPEFAS